MEKPRAARIDTTLGELIAAAGEVAFQYSDNSQEAFKIARVALIEILRNVSRPLDRDEDIAWNCPTSNYLN